MPVARCRSGAAWWAAAIDSHGGWRISVKTMPGEPGAGHLAGELLDVRQGGRFGHHVDVHATACLA